MMKEDDQSKIEKEEPDGLIIYKPEGQVSQKLHLCEYLSELYDVAEKENDQPAEEKKNSYHHLGDSGNPTNRV